MRWLVWATVFLLVGCTAAPTTDDPADTATTTVSTSTTDTTEATRPSTATSRPETATGATCWTAPVDPANGEVSFQDVTETYGLVEPLTGMYGHAAAFGYVNSDPRPDLAVGTFADRPPEDYAIRGATGPSPDRLLISMGDRYELGHLDAPMGRTSGAVFSDFDSDGDSDLLLIRNDDEAPPPSALFENRDGQLELVAEPLPDRFLGRTPAVADFDGDGLLDLYVSADRHGETSGVLLHNRGSLAFVDVTIGSGLEDVFALGATAADLNRDGKPDLVTSDRVFLGRGDLTFEEITPAGFDWERIGPDDDPAGVAVGDYNNDGLPDVLIGQHYRSIVEEGVQVPLRLFQNLGNGAFEEVTEEVGLIPLPTLAPHVEFADMDNDGWLDIVASGSVEDGAAPIVFANREGDFAAPQGLGSHHYWVGAPVVDVDLDGRLDVFGLEWEPSLPSRLFRNITSGGHWLEVSVADQLGGVGSVVEVFDQDGVFLGYREIGVASGYSSGKLAVAHFGLGMADVVDLVITTPSGETVSFEDVAADAHIRWPEC